MFYTLASTWKYAVFSGGQNDMYRTQIHVQVFPQYRARKIKYITFSVHREICHQKLYALFERIILFIAGLKKLTFSIESKYNEKMGLPQQTKNAIKHKFNELVMKYSLFTMLLSSFQ